VEGLDRSAELIETTELESVFERGGFGSVAYFGAYDPAVHAGATDRLVAVAQLSDWRR
jgi:hypothetical protein